MGIKARNQYRDGFKIPTNVPEPIRPLCSLCKAISLLRIPYSAHKIGPVPQRTVPAGISGAALWKINSCRSSPIASNPEKTYRRWYVQGQQQTVQIGGRSQKSMGDNSHTSLDHKVSEDPEVPTFKRV